MSTPLNFARDINGLNTFIPPASLQKYQTTLATDTAQSLTVPSDCARYIAVFSTTQGANVWVAINETAETPGSSFSLTNSDLNPPGLIVQAGDVLSFITGGTDPVELNVKFYSGIT